MLMKIFKNLCRSPGAMEYFPFLVIFTRLRASGNSLVIALRSQRWHSGVTVLSIAEFQTDHWTNKDVLHALRDWTGS